jgi:hypothetical protein
MVILVTSLMESGKVGGRTVGHFRNTFRLFAKGGTDAGLWRDYFLKYDPVIWDSDGDGGGVINFYDDDNKEIGLVIQHWHPLGFLLQLDCRNLTTNHSEWCKFSVGDPNRLDQFEVRDDLHYPVGCFLSPTDAWLAVEDFLSQPTQPSSRIGWIDGADVSWPE